MAIFQIKVSYISKNQKGGKTSGKSSKNLSYISRGSSSGRAGKSIAYIARENEYSDRDDLIHYEEKNLPKEFEDGKDFANTMEQNSRSNARLLKKYEMSLPREFSDKENIKIAKEFCEKKFGNEYTYFLGIHNPKGNHPHMHLSVCERKLDGVERDKEKYFKRANTKNPEMGGIKVNEEFATEKYFENFCKDWENHLNKHLIENGYEKLNPKKDKIQVENKTLKEEKIRSYSKAQIEKLDTKEVNKILSSSAKKIHENEKKIKRLYQKNIECEVLNDLSGNKLYILDNKIKSLTMTKSKNYIKFQNQYDSHLQAEVLKKEREKLVDEHKGTEKYFKLKTKKENERKMELRNLNNENTKLKNNIKKIIENRPMEEIKKIKENSKAIKCKNLKNNNREEVRKEYKKFMTKGVKKGERKNHKENFERNKSIKNTRAKVIQVARLVTQINIIKGIGNLLKDDSFNNISSASMERTQSKYERQPKEETLYLLSDEERENTQDKNIKINDEAEKSEEQTQEQSRGKVRTRTR